MARQTGQSLARDDSGAAFIYATLVMGMMIAIVSVSVNYGYRHVVLNRLQAAADAAALAGVAELPNEASVKAEANLFAERNMPAGDFNNQNKDVLADSDIQIGTWNSGARVFTPGGMPPYNAVRVVVRRSVANGNPHQLFMAGVFGAPDSVDIEAEAIAFGTASETSCYANGFIAQGGTSRIIGQSNNQFSGFCMHGRNGVEIGSDNRFSNNARVSMRSLSDFKQGSSNVIPAGTVYANDSEQSLAGNIEAILSDFKSLKGPFPSYINTANETTINGDYKDNGSRRYLSGRIYRIRGVAEVTRNISNVAIIADKEIKINSGRVLTNVVMTSDDKIDFGSNVRIGNIVYKTNLNPADCVSITSRSFLAARNNITFGSNLSLSGVQAISGDLFEVGSDIRVHGALGAQVANEIKVGSSGKYQSCDVGGQNILIGSGGGSPKLVR